MKILAQAYCSSANVGPGFDVFGLALNIFSDIVEIDLGGGGFIVEGRYGYMVPNKIEENLIGKILSFYEESRDVELNLGIRLVKGVPSSLGLGSSGASAVAFTSALIYGIDGEIGDPRDVLTLATVGEEFVSGYPHMDNIAASLLGGFTITSKNYRPISIRPPNWLRVSLLIPSNPKFRDRKTMYSRGLLKDSYPLEECVFNIERATLLVKGMMDGDPELIKIGLEDLISTPYRSSLVEGYDILIRELEELPIIGHFISGAGPTLAVLHMADRSDEVLSGLRGIIDEYSLNYHVALSMIGDGVSVWAEG
jgi:homoserine kinase